MYSQNSERTDLRRANSNNRSSDCTNPNNTNSIKNISGKRAIKSKLIALAATCLVMTSTLLSACSMEDVNEFAKDVYDGAEELKKDAEEIISDVAGTSQTSTSTSGNTGSNSTSDATKLQEQILETIAQGDYPTKEMQDAWEEIGLSDAMISAIQKDQAGLYYYDQLSSDEQSLYAQIYHILSNQGEEIYVTTTDMDEIEKVQQCVSNDHPEIFYVEGYSMNRYMTSNSDEIKAITYGGKYSLSKEEIASRRVKLQEAADAIIAGMPSTTDEYEIVKYFYDYIALNTQYQLDCEDNQNICSVLLNKVSVCQGYAKTLQYLLQRVGITCEMVSGTADTGSGGTAHAWNFVKVNGNWYYVDPTWGDASFTGSVPGDTEVVNYAYLCVTTADLSATHVTSEVVKLPECTATADNYFVRENALFDCVDDSKLRSVFDTAINEGRTCVTFKCTDSAVFNEMKTYLFSDESGAIFEYLPISATRASYLSHEATLTFMIWL